MAAIIYGKKILSTRSPVLRLPCRLAWTFIATRITVDKKETFFCIDRFKTKFTWVRRQNKVLRSTAIGQQELKKSSSSQPKSLRKVSSFWKNCSTRNFFVIWIIISGKYQIEIFFLLLFSTEVLWHFSLSPGCFLCTNNSRKTPLRLSC